MAEGDTIDVHVHTYASAEIGRQVIQSLGSRSDFDGTIEQLVPFMEQAGISRAVMVNFTPVADMMTAALARVPADLADAQRAEAKEQIRQTMVGRVQRRNQWSCQVAREHPRLAAFTGVDPVMDEETMAREVAACKENGAKGLKIHPEVQRFPANDRRLWPAYRAAEELRMSILFHAGPFGGSDGSNAHPRLFVEVARAFPRLTMVLAHCGGTGNAPDAIALARQFPNVYFDCCGVVSRDAGRAMADEELVGLLRSLGLDRIMFGSDWPTRDPRPDIERVLALPLSQAEQRQVLSENAARILFS